MPPSLQLGVTVGAGAPEVWRALADHVRRRAWWSHLDLQARPGGRLVERWRDADGQEVVTIGTVPDADEPRRLRCTWRDEDWPAATEIELSLHRRRGERHGGAVMSLYTVGIWTVKPGHEDQFVAAWEELAARTLEEFPNARGTLLRHREQPGRFVSFGPWQSLDQIDAWRASSAFQHGLRKMEELLDALQPGVFDVREPPHGAR